MKYKTDYSKMIITDAKKCLIAASLALTFSGYAFSQALTPKMDESKGKWGYIDNTGKWVVKPGFDKAGQFRNMPDGTQGALVEKNGTKGYLDPQGKPKGAGVIFSSIDSISPGAAIAKVKDKYAIVGWDMEYIQKPDFNYISPVDNSVYIVERGGKYGLVSNAGELLVKPVYTSIDYSHKDWYKIFKDDKCGLFDVKTQTLVLEPGYQDVNKMATISGNVYIPVCEKGKWGLINTTGAKILNFEYSAIKEYELLGLFVVAKNNKTYLFYPAKSAQIEFNKRGESSVGPFYTFEGSVVAPPSYDINATKLYNELFKTLPSFNFIYNSKGDIISKEPNTSISRFGNSDLYILKKSQNVRDVLDADGKKIATGLSGEPKSSYNWILFSNRAVSPDRKVYELISATNKNFVRATGGGSDNRWHMLNGGRIETEGYSKIGNWEGDFINIEKNGKWGVMSDGAMIIPFIFENEPIFLPETEYIRGTLNGKQGLYNKLGEIVVPHIYDSVQLGVDSYLLGYDGDKIALLDENGKLLIAPDHYSDFSTAGDFITARKNGYYSIFDNSGNLLVADKFTYMNEIEDLDDYYWIKSGNLWGVMNPSGKILIPIKYWDEDLQYESGLFEAKTSSGMIYYNLSGDIHPAKREIIVTSQYIEHNVYNNGAKGMKLHYEYDANFLNVDGEQIYVEAKVYKANGQPESSTRGGQLKHGLWRQPSYRSSHFNDQWIFLPYTMFVQGKGKVDYYIVLTFTDQNGKRLPTTGNSKINFYMTR